MLLWQILKVAVIEVQWIGFGVATLKFPYCLCVFTNYHANDLCLHNIYLLHGNLWSLYLQLILYIDEPFINLIYFWTWILGFLVYHFFSPYMRCLLQVLKFAKFHHRCFLIIHLNHELMIQKVTCCEVWHCTKNLQNRFLFFFF